MFLIDLTWVSDLMFLPYLILEQLRTYVSALVVFSTCGVEDARTRKPLNDWSLYQNVHNRRRALELLAELNAEKSFLTHRETIDQYFLSFNCGGSGMTLRYQANRYGFWKDGQLMEEKTVTGVHLRIRDHFRKTGFAW